jgi:hypothetical protein
MDKDIDDEVHGTASSPLNLELWRMHPGVTFPLQGRSWGWMRGRGMLCPPPAPPQHIPPRQLKKLKKAIVAATKSTNEGEGVSSEIPLAASLGEDRQSQ